MAPFNISKSSAVKTSLSSVMSHPYKSPSLFGGCSM